MAIAAAPIGRLTQKIADQPTCSVSTAPSEGPTIEATPNTLDSRPCTRARSVGV